MMTALLVLGFADLAVIGGLAVSSSRADRASARAGRVLVETVPILPWPEQREEVRLPRVLVGSSSVGDSRRDERGAVDGAFGRAVVMVAMMGVVAAGCEVVAEQFESAGGRAGSASAGVDGPGGGEVSGRELRAALGRVQVVEDRPEVDGYDREAFGPAWSDDHSGRGGHNGCDTRNDVLARDLTGVRYEDSQGCVVESGMLADPYTGESIAFDRDEAIAVQVEHIYPLAAAWDMGAAKWSAARRVAFANDVRRNLLAVDGPTNMSKGDETPAQWLPPNRGYRCEYLARYLAVADHYELAVTSADAAVVKKQAPRCRAGRGQ